jgi:hypothetical protein
MMEIVITTLFGLSFAIAIEEWLRKSKETFLLLLCAVLPGILHQPLVGLSSPIAVSIAIGIAIIPLTTAWRRDRIYGRKLLLFALPVMLLYILLAMIAFS